MNPTQTNAGRAAIAAAISAKNLFLAWGGGVVTWDTNHTATGTASALFVSGLFSSGFTEIDNVVITNTGTSVVLDPIRDYAVNGNAGTISLPVGTTITGSNPLSIAYHVKIATPAASATDLIAEIGRHKILSKFFVVPDEDGTIAVSSGTFSLSPANAPTNNLYLSCSFEPDNAPSGLIREVGIYCDGTTDGSLPSGQVYFTPDQVTAKGTLFVHDHLPLITRTSLSRETFQCVLTF